MTSAQAITPALSPKELEVLKAAAAGETAGQTAARLGRSVETVKTQRSSILAKLGVRSMTAAVAEAYCSGILGDRQQAVVEIPLTDGQRRALYGKCGALDRTLESPRGTAKKRLLASAPERLGREAPGFSELTEREASVLLDALDEELGQ